MLSRVWWTAGATRCDGRSPASWMMNSPKSVSVTSRPAASRAGLRWTSSVVIDFDLTTRLQLGLLGDLDDDPAGVLGRRPPSGRGRRACCTDASSCSR